MLYRTAGYGSFRKYVIQKLLPVYNRVGFENKDSDSFMDISLRELIISFVCSLGYEPCVQKSTEFFKSWMESPGMF